MPRIRLHIGVQQIHRQLAAPGRIRDAREQHGRHARAQVTRGLQVPHTLVEIRIGPQPVRIPQRARGDDGQRQYAVIINDVPVYGEQIQRSLEPVSITLLQRGGDQRLHDSRSRQGQQLVLHEIRPAPGIAIIKLAITIRIAIGMVEEIAICLDDVVRIEQVQYIGLRERTAIIRDVKPLPVVRRGRILA